jgi:hypothetical protein
MPEDMYVHEHPGHLEEARQETERVIEKRIARMRRRNEEDFDESAGVKQEASNQQKDDS